MPIVLEKNNLTDQIVASSSASKPNENGIDLEIFLLVSGVYQLQLLQLPVQPRKFAQCSVARLEDGGSIPVYEFRAEFTSPAEGAESEDKDAEEGEESEERDSQYKKLINIKIKLAPWAFWLSAPQPVRWLPVAGTWTTKGVWDVRFHEEIAGAWLRFCIEEPSVVALAQNRKLNLPTQGWSLYPSHMRSAMLNAISKNTAKKPDGRGGGEDWEAGMSDDSDEGDGDMMGEMGGGPRRTSEPARNQSVQEEPEEEDLDDVDDTDSVTLTISGAVVSLDIQIREEHVSLRKVRTSLPVNLQDITDKPMSPFELIKTLRKRGLELSPSTRVCSQLEDLPIKNPSVEKHLYRCMAIAASSLKFSFLFSKWNTMAGTDNCIFQFQMLQENNTELGEAKLVQVSPDRTRVLPFQETSQTLEPGNADEQNDSLFFADFLHALMNCSPPEIQKMMQCPSLKLVNTIYSMMASSRPLSTG